MRSQWSDESEDVPAKMGNAWDKTRAGAGTGKVVAIAAGVVAVVLIIGVIIATAGGGDTGNVAEDTKSTKDKDGSGGEDGAPLPKPGEYSIQVEHSGFCVGTRKQDDVDREVLVQEPCKDVRPVIELKPMPVAGVYTIGLYYKKEKFDACLAADSDKTGDLLGPQQCSKGEEQQFSLEPSGEKSFQLKTSGGNCVGVPEGDAEAGAMFAIAECAESAAYQRLIFSGGEVPGMPTKFGAWWAAEGKYGAKWEAPKDDGGSAITGYVIRECGDGKELFTLEGEEYEKQAGEKGGNNDGIWEVGFEAEKVGCVSVRAVNSSGEGAEASFEIED